MAPLNLPPIPGSNYNPGAPPATPGDDDDDDFDFEEIPFKADYKYTDPKELKTLLQEGQKVFGVAAASLTWGIDGNRMIPALEAGKEGEKQTASLLNRLAEKHPNVFVFHSLSWPESSGDTDHIMVAGGHVIVIDSKRWKKARKYSITEGGAIKRGTVAFPQGKVKIGYALRVWRKKLAAQGVKVSGVVTIAQEKVFVVRDKHWYKAPFRLVEYDLLEEFLEEQIQSQKDTPVKASTLLSLGMLLVAERNRAADIIRVGGERRINDLT